MSKRATILVFAASAMALLVLTMGVSRASSNLVRSTSGGCNPPPPPPPPMPPASDFVGKVDNKFFPLEPGTTFLYRGQEEGNSVVDKVVVTDGTKTILGVQATVVLDRVALNGAASEKTADWYAQDKQGDVWYLGESAFEFVNRRWVRSDDSWEAGRDGAQAGIIIEAHPRVGDVYRQEFYQGHAEDMALVLSIHARVSVPYGDFHHALKTMECTPLERGVFDVKDYGQKVGEVAEATVKGGSAELVLVSVTHKP